MSSLSSQGKRRVKIHTQKNTRNLWKITKRKFKTSICNYSQGSTFPVNQSFVFFGHLSTQAVNIWSENHRPKLNLSLEIEGIRFGTSFVLLISWVVMSDSLGKALPLPRSSGTKPCWWGLVIWVGVGVGTQMSLSQCLYYSLVAEPRHALSLWSGMNRAPDYAHS